MSRNYDSGFPREPQNFYPTPAWPMETLLKKLRQYRIRVGDGIIWEPCCGDGAIARVLEAHGYRVVATDLVDRGYGEGGRDFMLETRLPAGVTAIITNPPYGDGLRAFIDHALELLRPVGGVLILLLNSQWKTSKKNSARCLIPAYEGSVTLTTRIVWFPGDDGKPKQQPKENHAWLIWGFSRKLGPPQELFAGKDDEAEPEIRSCIVCRTPLPSTSRADARLCSVACRQRAKRSGMTKRRVA